jgi:alpha-D-ribose 1-methylphosphonate 5-triphosphate diphosphatase
MSETVFRNARLVLPHEMVPGSLKIEDGTITAIDTGPCEVGEDLDGDYLVPGLIELHTDQLEGHYRPRPGVYWNPMAALQAHDVQIAGSGITTVFDSVRVGSDPEMPGGMAEHVQVLVDAISAGVADGRLRADHLIHLRCELPTPDVVDDFDRFARLPLVKIASVMDHTPGQRQYQTISKYVQYYKERMRFSDAEMEAFIIKRQRDQEEYAERSRREIIRRGKAAGIAFASHDDATEEQVNESVEDGVSIAEFPTTMVAAEKSHAAGLAVLMGAPNIVRGGSHSGNIAAIDLAREGCLDVISSDYVPGALLLASFMLPELADSISLPDAIRMVTSRPAKAANLHDRGEIAVGKRGDVVRIRKHGEMPVVKGVWRQGHRVS